MNDDRISSVAIFRALKLGDMLCATPALRAIRRGWPNAHIALIALPWFREIAPRYGHLIDEMIDFPGYPGLPEQASSPEAAGDFINAMQDRRFDLVVQMHGSGEVTNSLVQRFRGRQTTGFYRPSRGCRATAGFLDWIEERAEPLRCLDLVHHLGIPPRGSWLELPVLEHEWAELDRFRLELDFSEKPFVCVHAGASVAERRWSSESFARVADRLQRRGYTVVLTGSCDERDITARVAADMQAPAVDLAGRTSLGLLAALVARSALVVCNDTGVSHMAAAARTPSVVISPVSDPRRWGPLDRRLHRVVDARAGSSVADVWESVEAILGGSEDNQRPHPAGLTMFASRSNAQRSERPITTK